MKRVIVFSSLIISCLLVLSFVSGNPINTELAIGSKLPLADYKMKDVSGKEISIADAKTAKGVLVIFSCNTCPYVKLSEVRIKEITDYCLKQSLGCIIINSNEAQRSDDDSFDEMVKYAQSQKLACGYVVDANSKLADAFGATRTPQCFLFNTNELVYKGAIDDNVKDAAAVKSAYLKDAINALLKGEKSKVQETKSIGCTIKRVE